MSRLHFRRGIFRMCLVVSVLWALFWTALLWDNITSTSRWYQPHAGTTVRAVEPTSVDFFLADAVISADGSKIDGNKIDREREKMWLVKTPYWGEFIGIADTHDQAMVAVYKHLGNQRVREQWQQYLLFVAAPIIALFAFFWLGIWIARGFVGERTG